MNNKSSDIIVTKRRNSDRLDIQNELADHELTKALEESQKQHEFGDVGTEVTSLMQSLILRVRIRTLWSG
ncbi:MAG: hypothetical protein KGZ93_03895 [Actinobacteria bacterium]|nr:hypothetical protein [Actinomycetota bacterium]